MVTVSALTDTDGQPGGNGPSQIYPGLGRFKDDTFAKISNFGADVDVLAPGVTILSLKLGVGTTNKLGTSMSAPHVAGVAAMIAANNPGATPAQIRQALINTGECSDGTVNNGAGCSKEWKGDPDDKYLGPQRAAGQRPTGRSGRSWDRHDQSRGAHRLDGHRRRRLRQPKLG